MSPQQEKHGLASAFRRQKHLDRFIVHLRQQCTQRKLNLVLGAGVCVDAGAPLWGDLIARLRQRMAELTGLTEDHLGAFGHTMAASVLLKWLEARIKDDKEFKEHQVPDAEKENYVKNRWNNLIRDAIYRCVPDEVPERIQRHPYLEDLAHMPICLVQVAIA